MLQSRLRPIRIASKYLKLNADCHTGDRRLTHRDGLSPKQDETEMSPSAQQTGRLNHLLAELQAEDRALLASAIRIECPPPKHVLSRRTASAPDIWFPNTGIIALSVTDTEGRTVQTGLVGSEGCVGLENMFPHKLAMADAWVQIAGEMSVIAAAPLRSALQARPAIQIVLARFLFELSAQSLQTVACNRLHTLEERCCRWLLMMRDRTDDDDLPLTQQCLATMLGSGRPRINVLLADLEKDGLVRRFRSRIRLLSRTGLQSRACECYRQLPCREQT
jgi:CRP-like cAMP-binding protein